MNQTVFISFWIDPTPSLRTYLPSQQSTATVGLECGSSPFNNAPWTINQTPRNYRLHPFHNYCQPYAHSPVGHTKHICSARAAHPVFYPAEGMKENWNLQAGDCHTRLWHESFTKGYTLICHCSHFHYPKRPRQEEGNLLNMVQKRTRKDNSTAEIPDLFSEEHCDEEYKQPEKHQLSHLAETEIEDSSPETARDNKYEKHALKQSEHKEQLKRGNSSLSTSFIHYIAPPKLKSSLSSVATNSREDQRPTHEIPSRVDDFWESMNRPDSERRPTYAETAKRCHDSERSVICSNENQKGKRRITYHPSRSEGSKYRNTTFFNNNWDKHQERNTMPPQKRKPLDSNSRVSLWVSQQKQLGDAHRLSTVYADYWQQSEGNNKQQLNKAWSGTHSSQLTEFYGTQTQMQSNATSTRLENNNGDNMKQRPHNSKSPLTSKFSTDEANEVDDTLVLAIPFHRDKSTAQLSSSARSNKPANSEYKEDNFSENYWAGYSFDRNDLPRIVAVHTIVEDRNEKPQRKELRGAKRLSSNEKKEWHLLLADLLSKRLDG